jgi:outer membrane receptor for ferrienterochelin and colicins
VRLIIIIFFSILSLGAQEFKIEGQIKSYDENLPYANIIIRNIKKGAISDSNGKYSLDGIPSGLYLLEVSYSGYNIEKKKIELINDTIINFNLTKTNDLDEIVITGTRTFKRQTNSPVIVNILTNESLNKIQACSLSDGLKFQPGLRVETDCQTCNYTQLRMNGLAGGYSQIVVNGRPVISPLTGMYALEQIPVNMIERIETIRGGGSTLYGSSAIGGVVNIITKTPQSNTLEFSYTNQIINKTTNDQIFNLNTSVVSKTKSHGVSFFLNKRDREYYDDNGDNFSELPSIENISLGTNFFFLPNENQKIESSISFIDEFRYGGEMISGSPHLNQQAEERNHKVLMGL